MYRDTTNVEHEMYDNTGNNWSHRNINKRLTKNLEAIPGKDSIQKTAILGTSHVIKDKDKAVPLQAWGGPEGSRKLRFPDFLTAAQDGGKFVSHTHRPHLPPGNSPGTHFC
jgi:hypothetical protein